VQTWLLVIVVTSAQTETKAAMVAALMEITKMKKAVMRKEWGEVGLGSSKRDGWAWEVYLYEADGSLYDRRTFNYYKGAGWHAAVNCCTDWAPVLQCGATWR
jgi:hypothetical protein